jgi:hypothetical protein
MTFQSLAQAYLRILEKTFDAAQHSGEATPELSYRPALHGFLQDLVSELDPGGIEIIFEPKKQGHAGRPDWRFYQKKSLGVYGFIEAKALDISNGLNPSKVSEQINRYLELGQNLILTDGIDFVFYMKSAAWQPKILSIVSKPLPSRRWHEAAIEIRLQEAFREFFSAPRSRKCSEEQLVGEVAKRASMLSAEISELVVRDPAEALSVRERTAIERLVELKKFLYTNHDPALAEPTPFSDFVAQVLCFGLLYSHRSALIDDADAKVKYQKIHQYWIDGLSGAVAPLRPFQELVRQLRTDLEPQEGEESVLSSWYDDCRHLLSYVELTETQRKEPDFHSLYERFLEKFDPKTRFDFGAFYTPRELAEFVIRLVNHIARETYSIALFDSDNKLIDPCCGTGTFIEQILIQKENWQHPTIVGFEILPAPYALAHYRLSLLPMEVLGIEDRVHILLTNTLSDLLERATERAIENPNLFQCEQIDARRYASPPIIAVIGNPPSSDSTKAPHLLGRMYSRISKLTDDFRPPTERRSARQNNQKQLRNEFVRFLRWSVDRVSAGDRGMVALVVPESFLEHGSYRYARKWLCENFSGIWVLDIDADQRARSSDAGIFNTLQGHALLIAARGSSEQGDRAVAVSYGSILGPSLENKKASLSLDNQPIVLDRIFPSRIKLDSLYRFRPGEPYNQKLWMSGWPIYASGSISQLSPGEHAIFVRHASALKLAATSLMVHQDHNLLIRRTREIGDNSKSFQSLMEKWFIGQRKPPAEAKLNILRPTFSKAAENKAVSTFALRPFVNVWAISDEGVLDALGSMPKGGARTRPEVRAAFASASNLAFAIAPSRKDLSGELHRFVSFCWGMPDNDLCRRGNAHVLCKEFPDYKRPRGSWNAKPHQNMDAALLERIPKHSILSQQDSLIFYCYAMLCSTAYLTEFSGALFTTAAEDNIPRVPITSNLAHFETISDIGNRLAELENPKTPVPLTVARNKLLKDFREQENGRLHISRKRVNEDDSINLELLRADGQVIFRTDSMDISVANFNVSGYVVLDEWIKWHSFAYSRTSLRCTVVEEFLKLITRIELQLALQETLTNAVEAVLNSREEWIEVPN